jgi:sodium-dependent dicarboxylate transporter 2/3/5
MKGGARVAALVAGPILAVILFSMLPDQYLNGQGEITSLSTGARAAGAIALWMAIWWMTEAIPVYATALLPLALFPLTGAASIKSTASAYGHELIYLFLGGFVLALALERCGLHRRLALRVLRLVGTRPTRIIGAFMGIAAFLSMWVTNTATTIMLLPVALSVIRVIPGSEERDQNFPLCLLLGLAYAASIGGIGTIVGTAPNVFLVSFIQTQMNVEISFVRWMAIGVPMVCAFVPITWWVLCRVVYPVPDRSIEGADDLLHAMNNKLGAMQRAEKLTLAIFILTAAAWVFRPVLTHIQIGGIEPLAGLTDAGIAVICALVLFITPVRIDRGEFLMDWETAVKLPWGLLILFGGGLSLAATLGATGFSEFLGSQATALAGLPVLLIVIIVTGIMIFLTELTSNTATTATLLPVFFAVALGLGLNPYLLVVPAGIAASCAFMLPVATPPNAIVFGAGYVTIPQMSRAGLWLNLIGMVLITVLTYAVIIPVLGIGP